MTQTIQSKSKELLDQLEKKTRTNGEQFYCLNSASPEWCTEVIRAAHGDQMPNDWRYEAIYSVLSWLAYDSSHLESLEDLQDASFEVCDNLIDVYYNKLTAWLSSSLDRLDYCDQASSEYGPSSSIVTTMQQGQGLEYQEVYSQLIEALDALGSEVQS